MLLGCWDILCVLFWLDRIYYIIIIQRFILHTNIIIPIIALCTRWWARRIEVIDLCTSRNIVIEDKVWWCTSRLGFENELNFISIWRRNTIQPPLYTLEFGSRRENYILLPNPLKFGLVVWTSRDKCRSCRVQLIVHATVTIRELELLINHSMDLPEFTVLQWGIFAFCSFLIPKSDSKRVFFSKQNIRNGSLKYGFCYHVIISC